MLRHCTNIVYLLTETIMLYYYRIVYQKIYCLTSEISAMNHLSQKLMVILTDQVQN